MCPFEVRDNENVVGDSVSVIRNRWAPFGAHMKLDFINDGPVTILLGDNYE